MRTKYKRQSLLDTLQIVSPALAKKDLIPVLTHVCFLGDYVMAYNDVIGIKTKIDPPTTFMSVSGEALIGLLSHVGAEEVSLTTEYAKVKVRAKGMKVELPANTEDSFPFVWPEDIEIQCVLVVDKEFLAALSLCLISTDDSSTLPITHGIFVVADDNVVSLCSTDNFTMSRCRLPQFSPTPFVHIISVPFAKQMLRLAGNGGGVLQVSEDLVLFKGKDVELCGRYIEADIRFDFDKTLGAILPVTEVGVPLSVKFQGIIKRAAGLVGVFGAADFLCELKIEAGALTLSTKGQGGEMQDALVGSKLVDRQVRFNPQHLDRAQDVMPFSSVHVTDKCLAYSTDRAVYLVATRN